MMADNDFDNSEMESFKGTLSACFRNFVCLSFQQKGSNLNGEKTEEFNSNDGDFVDEVLVPETPENNNENDEEGSRNHRSNGTNSDKVSTSQYASVITSPIVQEEEEIEIVKDLSKLQFPVNDNDSKIENFVQVIQIDDTPQVVKGDNKTKTDASSSESPISAHQQNKAIIHDIPNRQLFTKNFTFKEKGSSAEKQVQSLQREPSTQQEQVSSSLNFNKTKRLEPLRNPPIKTMSHKMSTSTPLLSNNRRPMKNVFDELDVTGIDLDEEDGNIERLNSSNGTDDNDDGGNVNASALKEVLHTEKSVSTAGASSSGFRNHVQQKHNTSDIAIIDDDEEEEEDCVEVDYNNQRMDKNVDEITSRLKKHHIDNKKPLIKYLEDVPALPNGNPFGNVNSKHLLPPREKQQGIFSAQKVIDAKSDVFKSAKLLANIIENMPMPDDDQSNFVQSKKLRINLYPHQVYGSIWMSWREGQYPGGGILADDMGLGKTITVMSLILMGKEAPTEDRENWYTAENKKLVHSKATLVVCPVGCLGQWESELRTRARGLRVLIFHGSGRTKSPAVLSENDVVLTTYNILPSEISRPEDDVANTCQSPLLGIHWERIILDEGHRIRNPKNHCALAACRLNAYHRWIITGTPVHNKPEDFYSLIKFLHFEPFSDPQVWKYWIGAKQVLKGCEKRLQLIGKALLLRRTKDEVNASSDEMQRLPPKHVEEIPVTLSEKEEAVYTILFDYAKSKMKMFLEAQKDRQEEMQHAANNYVAGAMKKKKKNGGGEDNKFATLLALITRLRQLAVLPWLIQTMLNDDDSRDSDDSDESDTEDYNPLNDPMNKKNEIFQPEFKSAKIKAVLDQLKVLKEAAQQTGEPMEKVIIVSSWTSFLNIMAHHLTKRGYTFVVLDGTVHVHERLNIMDKFNGKDKTADIMLLSITAGGVGLNLTGANHVYFVEPQWNPQIERQAQDRVHRIGQTKPVYIKRFIVQSSFEQRVMEIQALKIELADNLLSNTKKARGAGLNVQDLKTLFGLD